LIIPDRGKLSAADSRLSSGGSAPADAIPDSYQLLIGLLLCCCFLAVFLLKTARKQQENSNLERRM